MSVIAADSTVTMHFDIRLKDGSIAESTRSADRPMTFTMGQQVFSDKLEQELVGLQAEDSKKIMLMPEDAFGPVHEANIYQLPLSTFDGSAISQDELEPGLIVEFAMPNNEKMPGIIREKDEANVVIDFNHPLAGQVILFDVAIVEVS